jgi:hypothetical protein
VSMIDEGSDALVSLSSTPTIARGPNATPVNTNRGSWVGNGWDGRKDWNNQPRGIVEWRAVCARVRNF